MSDLVAFLRARLDEDEATARAAEDESPSPWHVDGFEVLSRDRLDVVLTEGFEKAGIVHIARHDPARVLREVAAKRAILDLHTPEHPSCNVCHAGGWDWDPEKSPCPTVRQLATVYSDHPDYDPTWALQVQADAEHGDMDT